MKAIKQALYYFARGWPPHLDCSPFLLVFFLSSVSDKQITIESGFLNQVPTYGQIMYDKGFNLTEECSSRFITVSVPPGRKGAVQMTPAQVVKTKELQI